MITSLLRQSRHLHRHSLPFPRQWTGPLTFHLKCITRCVGCTVCVGPLVRCTFAYSRVARRRVGAKCTELWANVRSKLCIRLLIAWKTHFWVCLCACEYQRDHLKWGLQILYQQNLVVWRASEQGIKKNPTQLKCGCGKTQIILKHLCVSPLSLYFLYLPLCMSASCEYMDPSHCADTGHFPHTLTRVLNQCEQAISTILFVCVLPVAGCKVSR